MATFILNKRHYPSQKDVERTSGNQNGIIINVSLVVFLLICSILLLSFFYLSQFNDISSQGVVIDDLERNRSKLIIENEVWNMRIAKLKSLDVIEKQSVVQRMPVIDPSEIEFIQLHKTP